MKKILLLVIFILVCTLSYSQKYYGSIGPCFSFDTSIKEYKGLIGGGIEVGRNYENFSVGINTSLWTLNKKDIYSLMVLSIPLGESNFSVSGNAGWFYYYKDITMGYCVLYTIPLEHNNSISISFGDQSAFLSSIKSLSLSFGKQF